MNLCDGHWMMIHHRLQRGEVVEVGLRVCCREGLQSPGDSDILVHHHHNHLDSPAVGVGVVVKGLLKIK